MKKIFETNDKRESNFLKNHLNDKYYESEIRNTSGKYELFVNENIYDEVLIEINKIGKKLSGDIVLDKKESLKENKYKKGSFLYFVEKYFQLKYIHLFTFSIIYSLIINIPFIIVSINRIIVEKSFNTEYLVISLLPFCIMIFLSQLILICTRYYQTLKMVNEIFVIKIGKKNDYSSLNYKIINFIIVIIGHIVITGFMIKLYIELM